METLSSQKLQQNSKIKLSHLFDKIGVGTKVTFMTMLVVGILFISYNLILGSATKKLAHERSVREMANTSLSISNSLESFDKTVGQQINRFADMFSGMLQSDFTIDKNVKIQVADKSVITLKNNNEVINMNFKTVDDFSKMTGVSATIFVLENGEFVRVSTSLKNDKGERAIGTILSHASPAYNNLINGESYNGVAKLFGKDYTTTYRPLKDKNENIVGAMFVGLDVSNEMQALKNSIRTIKIAKSGYVSIIDSNNKSDSYGEFIVDSENEGKNLLKDSTKQDNNFIKQMLEKQNGEIQYNWLENQGNNNRTKEKVVTYQTYKKWQWLIATGTYENELTGEMGDLYDNFTFIGIVVLVLLNISLYYLLKHMISHPLLKIKNLADNLAQGNLTVKVAVQRKDEIGQLFEAMNHISEDLSKVVEKVRTNTEQITTASLQIAAGNNDLSYRTEEQAVSLEKTVNNVDQLTQTIKHNAEKSINVSSLLSKSSQLALNGGNSMKELVTNMHDIDESNKKIIDIVSVIEGIAFQTNILALNATIEAARAGEQGRGFAVVAGEVRNLAQRSSLASKDIKELINLSVDNINKGKSFVTTTEENINEVVKSVNYIDTIMKDIAYANKEQTIAIEQINHTMIEMDNVTQQNAALVEQSAAATNSMSELAVELSKTVEVFKID